MEVDLDYFESNFLNLEIRLITVQRHIISKYILLELRDEEFLKDCQMQKAYSDLKKFYSKVTKKYKNFKISKDHSDNLDRILQLGKMNYQNKGVTVMKIIFKFLFATKNYYKINYSKVKIKEQNEDKIMENILSENKSEAQVSSSGRDNSKFIDSVREVDNEEIEETNLSIQEDLMLGTSKRSRSYRKQSLESLKFQSNRRPSYLSSQDDLGVLQGDQVIKKRPSLDNYIHKKTNNEDEIEKKKFVLPISPTNVDRSDDENIYIDHEKRRYCSLSDRDPTASIFNSKFMRAKNKMKRLKKKGKKFVNHQTDKLQNKMNGILDLHQGGYSESLNNTLNDSMSDYSKNNNSYLSQNQSSKQRKFSINNRRKISAYVQYFWDEINDKILLNNNDEKKEKLIKDLFKSITRNQSRVLITNYTRVRLYIKQFRKYRKYPNTFHGSLNIGKGEVTGFFLFKDRGIYFFHQERHYLKDERNFSSFIFLIRFDEFICQPCQNEKLENLLYK